MNCLFLIHSFNSILFIASYWGHTEVVSELIRKGASINCRKYIDRQNALHLGFLFSIRGISFKMLIIFFVLFKHQKKVVKKLSICW